jgi:hypothetical protein
VSRRNDATEANFLLTEYMSQFKRDLGQKGDEAVARQNLSAHSSTQPSGTGDADRPAACEPR